MRLGYSMVEAKPKLASQGQATLVLELKAGISFRSASSYVRLDALA